MEYDHIQLRPESYDICVPGRRHTQPRRGWVACEVFAVFIVAAVSTSAVPCCGGEEMRRSLTHDVRVLLLVMSRGSS